MSENIAVETHPPQHEHRADGTVGQRERKARHQRGPHEPERLERGDQQRVTIIEPPSPADASSVASQAMQRRASTSVDGKRARTRSRSCSTAIDRPSLAMPLRDLIQQHRGRRASTAANGSSSRITAASCIISRRTAPAAAHPPTARRSGAGAAASARPSPRPRWPSPAAPVRAHGTRRISCQPPSMISSATVSGIVGVEACALRQVGQPLRRGAFDAAAGQPHGSGDRRQQGALARAVGADDGGQAARCELAADRIQRQSPPVADRYIP